MDATLDSLHSWTIRTCDTDALMYVMFFMEPYNLTDFNLLFKKSQHILNMLESWFQVFYIERILTAVKPWPPFWKRTGSDSQWP